MATKHIKRQVRYGLWGFLFVVPFLLAFVMFQLIPVLSTAFLSLTNMNGTSQDYKVIGLANFARLSQSFELADLEASQVERLGKALSDASIDFYTDMPAADSAASSQFDLEPSQTPASPDPNARYLIKITKLGPEDYAKAKAALATAGMDDAALANATSLVYSGLIFDKVFWQSFGNTVLLFVMSFAPQFCFALLFALWLADINLKIRRGGWFKTIFYLPNLVMTSSIVVFFTLIFDSPMGPVNKFLTFTLGLPDPVNFFRNELWTRGIVAFIQFWSFFGTTLILLSAGIIGIPATYVEASMIDGAKPRQIFWHVTLPLLRPIILFTLVTSMISGLQLFDIPYLMTGPSGGINGVAGTTAMYMYNLAFSSANNYSYGSTISMGMFGLMLILAAVMFRILRNQDDVFRKKAAQ